MSRDKYSDDHTITVNEGTGTLTVDGNLGITGAFDLDDISLTNPVNQRMRFLGAGFRPDDGVNVVYSTLGRFIMNQATNARAFCIVPALPHGATITGIEGVGSAEDADGLMQCILYKGDGNSSTSVAALQWVDELESTKSDSASQLVDYTDTDSYYFLIYAGYDAGATAGTYLNYVDILYTIQSFPQNSETTPV
jgi:hypothetical protein